MTDKTYKVSLSETTMIARGWDDPYLQKDVEDTLWNYVVDCIKSHTQVKRGRGHSCEFYTSMKGIDYLIKDLQDHIEIYSGDSENGRWIWAWKRDIERLQKIKRNNQAEDK